MFLLSSPTIKPHFRSLRAQKEDLRLKMLSGASLIGNMAYFELMM